MKSQRNKLMTGLAGEYFVAGMMNLKGWVASLSLKNYPGVDIFGMNPATGENANIQVKTCWDDNFFIGIRRSQRGEMDARISGPFVFVHCECNIHGQERCSFYIVPKHELIELVNKTDDEYYDGEHRRPIKEDYTIALSLKHLLPYRNRWENLWEVSNIDKA